MLTRLFWINDFLGIMPRPMGNENLIQDIQHWKNLELSCVVSLLEKQEISDLGLKQELKLLNYF